MRALSLWMKAPISRFSITVRVAKILRPSGTWTMPCWTISCGSMRVMSSSSKRMCPVRVRSRPEMVLSVVDFPAPLAPIRVTISPFSR